jgi:hypothetical protein
MSLEARIQQSVEAALAGMRTHVEADVRSMVEQLISAAKDDREVAVDAALRAAAERVDEDTARRVAEAEARTREVMNGLIERARQEEREHAADAARRLVEVEANEKLQGVVAEARAEMRRALTTAETRAEQTIKESVAAARVGERETDMAGLSRLLESIRGLDGATTLSEVLDALAQAAAREASRAAVLVVRSDRLLGWKLTGFGIRDAQPKQIDLAVSEAGLLGVVVGTARLVTTRDAAPATGTSFVELPEDRMGLAVPVVVGGRVVAVLYADGFAADGREGIVPSSWPEVIEILARHAARCLEALTVQKAAGANPNPRFWVAPAGKTPGTEPPQAGDAGEAKMPQTGDGTTPLTLEDSARRFARLLLSEVKLYHESAVEEGRRARNLLSRLAPEIAQARQAYEARVPASLRKRAELFHQELIATLAGGDAALLGLPA